MSMSRKVLRFAVLVGFALTACLYIAPGTSGAQSKNDIPGLESAPLNPHFVRYVAEKASVTKLRVSKKGRSLGYVPSPLKLPPTVTSAKEARQTMALPAKFDLRTSKPVGVTPVRDQGECGSCWTFGAIGSLESYLKYKKRVNTDFSEADLNENHGFDNEVCGGGDWMMSTAYMARWGGPASEADVPYPYWFEDSAEDDSATPSVETASLPSARRATPGVPVKYHIERVYLLSNEGHPMTAAEITLLKQAIYDNGAVDIAYAYDEEYDNEEDAAYYNNVDTEANHEVSVVGWDDNFSSTLFKTEPPGDGAFIVKNSWSDGYGDKGYFYLSYYDTSIEIGAQYFPGDDSPNYSRIYQYDPLGWTGSKGYSTGDKTTAWFSNMFMASPNASKIRGVAFYTPVANSAYELYLYKNSSPGNPRSGTQVLKKSGTVVKPGYNTISFNEAAVAANKPFSVVVKLTTPGNDLPIPIENRVADYSSAASSCEGQSYISQNGTTWTSGAGNFNVALKALAVK
jgi:C1A family cysteine protease